MTAATTGSSGPTGSAPVIADLLSDTVTRPSAGMREAMARAEVGDDVFGEDPTVRALEERVAGLLGHEAALFVPSGTMSNQLGLRLSVPPGAELIADQLAHVVRAELGAAAVLAGISSRTWPAPSGRLRAADPLGLMAVDVGPYQVGTALIVVENTHNFGGGTIQPIEEIEALRVATAPLGVRMHLDGARLWNAHVATGIPLARYASAFDTVSVCLSKGLGAPVGSVLVADAAGIEQARVWRKRLGGSMRQAGILAAAGLYAIDRHLERLADDHRRAREFARVCAEAAPGFADPETVETNIVMLDAGALGVPAAQVVAAFAAHRVRCYAAGPDRVRLVWHLDIDEEAHRHALAAARAVCAGLTG